MSPGLQAVITVSGTLESEQPIQSTCAKKHKRTPVNYVFLPRPSAAVLKYVKRKKERKRSANLWRLPLCELLKKLRFALIDVDGPLCVGCEQARQDGVLRVVVMRHEGI